MSESPLHKTTGPPGSPLVRSWRTTARQLRGRFGRPVDTTFRYDPDDPWAVRTTFRLPLGVEIHWTFSRELLRSGTRVLSGEGDIRLCPLRTEGKEGVVRLRLGPAEAFATVDVDRAGLRSWLAETYEVVPDGEEAGRIDWAAEASQLFARP
ncbi:MULTISPECIES: SsgA family sporulation/cell division regulator [unclassified Streptomyces]|uniref:SsgA family sporulation/cell division regulator n=1 Tax=unclassified Streptomyces TaxID=2593676 RepID=UPI003689338C